MKNNALITKLGQSLLERAASYKVGDFHQAVLDVAYKNWQDHNSATIYEVRGRADGKKVVVFSGTRSEISKRYEAMSEEERLEERNRTNVGVQAGQIEWGYGEMLDEARELFGELFFAAVLVGKYNQQVENGGHIQYFDNGFAGREGGGFGCSHDPEIELHKEMLEAFEFTIVPLGIKGYQSIVFDEAFKIMSAFEVFVDDEKTDVCTCEECSGQGQIEDPDDDEGDWIECPECSGAGEVECDNDNYGCVANTLQLQELDTLWYAVNDKFMATVNHVIAVQCGITDPNAAHIFAASAAFETEFKSTEADPNYLMPNAQDAAGILGASAIECYRRLADDKLNCRYLEEVIEDGILIGYSANKPTIANRLLSIKIRKMPIGSSFSLAEISAEFDVIGPDGPRQDVIDRYVETISYNVEYKYLAVAGDLYVKMK